MQIKGTRRIVLIILTLLSISLTTLILSACSKEESVTKTFQAYKDNWEKQDFKAMYSMLTSKSKGKISEQQFVDRYTVIYKGIGAQNLKINWDEKSEIDEKKKETITNTICLKFLFNTK